MTATDVPVDEYTGKDVYDPSGTLLGTVADVDGETGTLLVEPDPDPTEEAWAEVGDGEYVNYDANWFATPDYSVWSASDADGEFDEWPYTVDVAEVGSVDDDAIRLESVSVVDLLASVLPSLGEE